MIGELFEEFVLFFAPDLHEVIDFTKDAEFLQQELYKEVIKERKGLRIADQIVKVNLNDGKEKCVLIHIEIQGGEVENFGLRMFQYFYRIFDHFEHEVYAIAILTDVTKTNPQNTFHYSFYGTEAMYKYNTYSFQEQEIGRLKQFQNPFASAVLAGIYANKSKDDAEKRYQFKRELMREILENATKVDFPAYLSALFYFIDYLLQIPHDLTKKLRHDFDPLITKEAAHMLRSDSINSSPTLAEIFVELEEKGFEKGIEKGIEKGKYEEKKTLAFELIKDDFSNEYIAKLTKLSIEEIAELRKTI